MDHNQQHGGRMFFDGKRMRKAVVRRTVDFNCSLLNTLEHVRTSRQGFRDQRPLLPETSYILNVRKRLLRIFLFYFLYFVVYDTESVSLES